MIYLQFSITYFQVQNESHIEDDVTYYSVTLAETDTGLILVQDEVDGGGVILKLP